MTGLGSLNALPEDRCQRELVTCCGSRAWARAMLSHKPFQSEKQLLILASDCWWQLPDEDWKEAFSHHPRIGDLASLKKKYANEQAGVQGADAGILQAFADGNRAYEEKFGFVFLICATGKSASEMLQALQTRLLRSPKVEILQAAREQELITNLRLRKLLETL